MKGPEDVDRSDGATCEFWCHIGGNTREPEHLNIESFPGCFCGFELFSGVVPQPKVELLPRHRLLHGVGMTVELVADGCSDEVSAVRVKPVLDHQVDMAEVNVAKINRDLEVIGEVGPLKGAVTAGRLVED